MLTFLLLICLAFWLKSGLTILTGRARVCTLLFWLLAKYGQGDERQNKRQAWPAANGSADQSFHAGFLLSLVGILSRPIGPLSLFWPVNAILLGLLLRKPIYGTPLGWLTHLSGHGRRRSQHRRRLVSGAVAERLQHVADRRRLGIMPDAATIQRRMGKPQAILYMFSASLAGAAVASTLSVLRTIASITTRW